jgi:TolA-binding protein
LFLTFACTLMMKRIAAIFFCSFWLLQPSVSVAQLTPPERQAWGNLGKERWGKAEAQVAKALRKDDNNLAAHYVYAWYFFSPGNPAFNIDSAHAEAGKAKAIFLALPKKDRERWLRFPIDSVLLMKLQYYIDSAAFERAKLKNSEEAYTFFIEHFPNAQYVQQAVELQNEAAFLDALKGNTYQSFLSFWQRYPQSSRAKEARQRYDKLLVEVKTKDKRLISYERFLQEYPDSPYRHYVEGQIFELFTASGEPERFETFLQQYPNNHRTTYARDILFHVYLEQEKDINNLLTDSLRHALALHQNFWLAVWRNGSYSFMDASGAEHLPTVGDSINLDFLCEAFTEDVLLVGTKLMGRNGRVIKTGVVGFTDLGHGFLSVRSKHDTTIVHKSGREVLRVHGKANLLGQYFFLVGGENQLSLFTLTGRKLPTTGWKEAQAFGNVIAFRTDKGWRLTTVASLGNCANGEELAVTDFFDEVKKLSDGHVWVRAGTQQGLLSNSLQVIVPLKEQVIQYDQQVLTVTDGSGTRIVAFGKTSKAFSQVKIQSDWVVAKQSNQFVLMDMRSQSPINEQETFDSLYVVATTAIGIRHDSTFLYTRKLNLAFAGNLFVQLLSASDSIYLCVHEGDRKMVVSTGGEKIFSFVCDKLEYVGAGFFVAARRKKKIVLTSNGKFFDVPNFDALGSASQHYISILQKKKFGLLNAKVKKVIPPAYERNLAPYTARVVVAYKDKGYGFVDWDNNALSKFEFEEVRYWNDSTALVKFNFVWRLYNIANNVLKPGKISEYHSFQVPSSETFAIFRQDNYYGLMGNRHGVILEPAFTAIVNVGTKEAPLYFTEKYIEEAAIYIVIYYDQHGKQLRRQIFEEVEYRNIKCEE